MTYVFLILYLLVGASVATHAHWHQSFRNKSYKSFVIQTLMALAFWHVLLVVRMLTRDIGHNYIHAIDMPPHVFDDYKDNGINTFCLERIKNPGPGDLVVLRCIRSTPGDSMAVFRIRSLVATGDGLGILPDHVMVVCDKDNVF